MEQEIMFPSSTESIEKKKRKRTCNFFPEEVRVLVDLVIKYASVIENKRTDAAMWKEKNVHWEKITRAFNATAGTTTRSITSIKMKYENLKTELRKKYMMYYAQEPHKARECQELPFADYELKLMPVLNLHVRELCNLDNLIVKEECEVDFKGVEMVNTTTDAGIKAAFDTNDRLLQKPDVEINGRLEVRPNKFRKLNRPVIDRKSTMLTTKRRGLLEIQEQCHKADLRLKMFQLDCAKKDEKRKEIEHQKRMELLRIQMEKCKNSI